MSVKERPREEKAKSEKKKQESIPIEMQEKGVMDESQLERETTTTKVIPATDRVTRKQSGAKLTTVEIEEVPSPAWGGPEESAWMYSVPEKGEDRSLWAKEWSEYLLKWAQAKSVHVLSVASFITETPFREIFGKVEAFNVIVQKLIERGIAEWMDRKKRQVRIYWRPLEEWADLIYAWALRKGYTRLDVKSLIIQEGREAFSGLPERDLKQVMLMLVERDVAEWIDKRRGSIKLKL